ncbi:MAG: STAS domain-containing protein [Planctomycetota bacterium]
MRIEREDNDGLVVLRVIGDIDFGDTRHLLAQLRGLQDEGQQRILMNLSQCAAMVSSAIGILVGFRCELAAAGGCFWVMCPSPEVKEILELVGLFDQLVRPEATESAAVAAV